MALSVAQSEDQCNFACLEVYDPVCGFNGKCIQRFDNDCFMKAENCVANASGLPGKIF